MDIFQGGVSSKHKTIVILCGTQRSGLLGIYLHLFLHSKVEAFFFLWNFVVPFGKFNQTDFNNRCEGFGFTCSVHWPKHSMQVGKSCTVLLHREVEELQPGQPHCCCSTGQVSSLQIVGITWKLLRLGQILQLLIEHPFRWPQGEICSINGCSIWPSVIVSEA